MPSPRAFSFVAFYLVVVGIWLYQAIAWATVDPSSAIRADFILEFLLLVGAGLVLALWTVAFGRGLVGLGSGAGFRVAVFGVAAHLHVNVLLAVCGCPGGRLFADQMPIVRTPIVWTRNASLIAYGLGLALVVESSIGDWSRRRSASALHPLD
jgi:hypothetical protein